MSLVIFGFPGYAVQVLSLLVAIGCFWLPPRRTIARCYLWTATAAAILFGAMPAVALLMTSNKS